jgi:hypothetical protein
MYTNQIVGVSLLAMAAFGPVYFWMVYISIPAVTASYGSALTAASLPRCPLRRTCVRPSDGADQDQKQKQDQDQKIAASFHSTAPTEDGGV